MKSFLATNRAKLINASLYQNEQANKIIKATLTNCNNPEPINFDHLPYVQMDLTLTANQVQCYQFSTPSSVFVSGTGYTLEGLDPNQNLIASKNNAFFGYNVQTLKITATQATNLEMYALPGIGGDCIIVTRDSWEGTVSFKWNSQEEDIDEEELYIFNPLGVVVTATPNDYAYFRYNSYNNDMSTADELYSYSNTVIKGQVVRVAPRPFYSNETGVTGLVDISVRSPRFPNNLPEKVIKPSVPYFFTASDPDFTDFLTPGSGNVDNNNGNGNANNNNNNSGDSNSLDEAGGIAGIVIACILGVAGLVVAIVAFIFARKNTAPAA